MRFLENFYIKTLKHDLMNKFIYDNSKKLPYITKIILNFGCKNNNIKNVAASLLALELITRRKGKMTFTNHSNIQLKIRKGNPAGCTVTLRKKQMLNFFSRMLTEIFSNLKDFSGFKSAKNIKAFSYEISDIFSFQELEDHYDLFNVLSSLNITLVLNTKSKEELIFIFNSLKFPFK